MVSNLLDGDFEIFAFLVLTSLDYNISIYFFI